MVRWSAKLLLPLALLTMAAGNPETPAPRAQPWWMQRHQQKLREVHRGPVDLIFLGDSIFQELESANPAWGNVNTIWQRFYACRHAVNLGFSGDTTGNVLWRLQNGEVDGIAPRLAVVMVGTNNIRPAIESAAAATAQGIAALVLDVHARLPATRILLLGIPPSGRPAPVEQERAEVNALLARREWAGLNTTFVDIDAVFAPGGTLDISLYREGTTGTREGTTGRGVVHPNAQGWQKLAAAIEPTVGRLLGEPRLAEHRALSEDVGVCGGK